MWYLRQVCLDRHIAFPSCSRYCGLLDSDEQVQGVVYPVQYPRIPGHEIIGDVAAIPPSETRWKLGDRVGAGAHGGHCHICQRCRVGDFMTCENEDIKW